MKEKKWVEEKNNGWKPRFVIEAELGSITTHDAITYSRAL